MSVDTSQVRKNEPVAVSKLRNLRVESDLWNLAKVIADRRFEPMSQIMKRALVEYVEAHATDEDREKAAELTRLEREAKK